MVLKIDNKIWGDIEYRVQKGLEKGTDLVKEEIGDLIFGAKNGRTYIRGPKQLADGDRGFFTFDGGIRTHKASAPGESFANDYGAWWGSLLKINKEFSSELVTGVDYARMLEFGTSKMAARPTMRPALANKTEAVVVAVQDEVSKAFK